MDIQDRFDKAELSAEHERRRTIRAELHAKSTREWELPTGKEAVELPVSYKSLPALPARVDVVEMPATPVNIGRPGSWI